MRTSDIQLLYEFDNWATNAQNVAISNLSEEQYFRDVHSSFGSIHGTVVHIFGAQQVWLTRWKGSSPKGLPTPDLFPSFAGLVEQWNVLRKEFDAFLAALNEIGRAHV